MAIRAKWALRCAAGCSALLALLWFAAFHVGFVERADQKVFAAFYNLTSPDYHHRVHTTAHFLVSLCNPSRFAFLAVVPVVIALARRRPRDACAVVVLIGGAAVTTLVLKHLLPQPMVASPGGMPSPVPYPRFPSGHTTLAMSLVLALTFVTPARLRPLVAGLGAVFAAAVGYSLLTIGSHYPTDVFGGILVATMWSLLTAAGLLEFERRLGTSPNPSRPISVREALTPPVVALLVAAAVTAIAVIADAQSIVSYVREHDAFTAGLVLIGVLSTAVSTGVVLSVRRDAMP